MCMTAGWLSVYDCRLAKHVYECAGWLSVCMTVQAGYDCRLAMNLQAGYDFAGWLSVCMTVQAG